MSVGRYLFEFRRHGRVKIDLRVYLRAVQRSGDAPERQPLPYRPFPLGRLLGLNRRAIPIGRARIRGWLSGWRNWRKRTAISRDESGRLSRMSPAKKEASTSHPRPSVNCSPKRCKMWSALSSCTFVAKQELLSYLKTTARRSESTVRASAGSVRVRASEADSAHEDAAEQAAS